MSAHKAEAFHVGVKDGHEDAQAGQPQRREFPAFKVKARDGFALIYDEADANAYWSAYIRSYQDEAEARR